MSVKQTIFIAVYGLLCFGLSLAFVQCSAKNAQKQVSEARSEANELRASLSMAEGENAALRESMAKYDDVLKQAISAIEKAYKSHVERVEEIHDLPDDWLQCELPSGVQDVFADYCYGDAEREAARIVADSVRKADGIKNGNQ